MGYNPLLMAPAPAVQIPPPLVQAVKDGKCVLFLGAMVSAKSPPGCIYTYKVGPPGGGQLSNLLARVACYQGADKWNLLRVAQYFELQRKAGWNRAELGAIVKKVLTRPRIQPSPAMHMLAALPFGLIVTTNYDHLFETALRAAAAKNGRIKNPRVLVYDKNPERRRDGPLDLQDDEPTVFKMHGDYDDPESMVITEEDYIHFIEQMGSERTHPIPENIRARVRNWPILFVGYGLKDWNLRVLLRALSWNIKAADLKLSFSVDPYPDQVVMTVMENSDKRQVQFLPHNLWDFVPALYEAVMKRPYP